MTATVDIQTKYHILTMRKVMVLAISIVGVILAVGFLSLSVCPDISLGEAYGLIWNHLIGTEYVPGSQDWWNDRFIWNRSLPRSVCAIVAGIGLAASGVMMQSLMNNPLADPYSTGISSGACFGAVASIVMASLFNAAYGDGTTIIFAFLGAMIPAMIIILISSRILVTPATLILLGTAISYFFNSMITYMMVTTDADTLQNAYIWQIGTLDTVTWSQMPIIASISIAGAAVVLLLSKKLNLLALGDNSAKTLGLDVESFRIVCLMVMAVMTAGIVSFTGILGFVGLVTPHIVRFLVGSDNKFVTPISMAFAAFLLLISDYLSQTVFDVQVGAVLALIGSPIFFILIVTQRKGRGMY
ncbi:iron ABC transporter permease protein [methanogenic archaeon mixed culture ISO4-G1]|nr:iron ABC transporter permease protein [methanogenic archaeon mixed culture ISO4-G1]